ncbi:MAG: D-aminoacyl-tRNA deacylase [Thermoleophilia bacterium]|nr:D-aminoacyl-tRNA deacylase [Thermoleophilia bacterium]
MRCLLQRVSSARVEVGGQPVGEIGRGLLALIGVAVGDDESDAALLARKTLAARLFAEGERPFHLSVGDGAGSVLVVSQFTLYGDLRRGNRPSWSAAAPPEAAESLVEAYAAALLAGGASVQRGRFGADMQVSVVNDGPVTLLLDTEELARPRRS